MEPARALADLVEISPQIEAAAILAREEDPAGSVGVPEGRAGILARAVRELLERAGEFRGDAARVTQLHASLAEGELFAVAAADGRTIVATTREWTTPGLLFYDLKRCLAAVAEPKREEKPKPRRRRKKEADAEA